MLIGLYTEYGYYKEKLISITKKGKSGLEEIQAMIEGYRKTPPTELGGSAVTQIIDYQAARIKNLADGLTTSTNLPKSNFVQFITADGDKVTARPSGTEPKIKFYFSVKGKLTGQEKYLETTNVLNTKIDQIVTDLGL